ncbi:MAG: lipopolysaccharide heptosyltransferase II [Thermoanaerobaculia bacterium]
MNRLVIAPNWIGDSVMSLPFLRALKAAHPGDRLAVYARRGPAAIYRAEGSADEVLERSGLLADAAALRRGRFDEAWLLPNSFRSAIAARLSGAPRRIGYATDRRGPLLTRALAAPPSTIHQLRDYDALLEANGVRPDLEAPRLPIPEAAAEKAREVLAGAGLSPERLVLLAPGSAAAETKRWPFGRFAGLGDRLAERRFGCAIVIGPGERDLGARVSNAARAPLPVLGADLDPVELAAVLKRARLVVSNDSGPMHLAAAVGTPVVALFGPTDPGRTAPSGAPSRVLDRYVFCSPCFRDVCPYGHECLEEIAVGDVLRACEGLIGA